MHTKYFLLQPLPIAPKDGTGTKWEVPVNTVFIIDNNGYYVNHEYGLVIDRDTMQNMVLTNRAMIKI